MLATFGPLGGGADVAKQKKKKKTQQQKKQLGKPAALLYGTRSAPFRCGRLRPANMGATCFFGRGVTALAGLLLVSFGSWATKQTEVGVRPSAGLGPGRTAFSWLRAPSRCPIHLREGSLPESLSFSEARWTVGRVSQGTG